MLKSYTAASSAAAPCAGTTTAAATVPAHNFFSSTHWSLASLSLAMLLPSLGISIANVGLPSLAEAFNASLQRVQWVVLGYLLATTTLIVSVGRLGDIVGRKRLLLVGIALFTAASAAGGFAPTLWLLVAARAVQGLGAAIMMALAMALIGDAVPKARTGSAMGLLGTMSAVGTALGPSLGGLLIAMLGWQAIFLIKLPLGLLALMLAWRHLPPDRIKRKGFSAKGFDPIGTLLLALTLAAYALAMTWGRGHFGALNIALLLSAALGAGLFILVEAKAVSPLIRLSLLRERQLGASLFTSAMVSTVVMSTLVVGPFYLSRALGLHAAVVGLVLSAGPLVSALTGVPAGRLVDRLGTRRVALAGLAAMALGCVMLAMTPGDAMPLAFSIACYIAPIVIITSGYALFQAANNTTVMAEVAAEQRGMVSGLLNLSRNLGLITGASLMAAVFALASASSDIATAHAAALAHGMRISFAVAAGLMVVALGIAGISRALNVRSISFSG